MRAGRTTAIIAILSLLSASRPGPARAQVPAEDAQALFESARELMLAGRFAEACAKLERSEALDPGIGTQFNLARCYDLAGRLASARAAYERVIAETHAAGQASREAVARDLVAALEPRLAHVSLLIRSDGVAPGMQLHLDDVPVPFTGRGTTLPVDPGPHTVVASAPGSKPWRGDFTIQQEGESAILVIPPLAPIDSPIEPSSQGGARERQANPTDSAPARGHAQHIAAVAVAALGVGGLGVGSYYGIEASSRASDARPLCPNDRCNTAGFSLRSESRSDGDISTVSFIVGAILVAAGVVIWLTVPSDSRSPARHLASVYDALTGGTPIPLP